MGRGWRSVVRRRVLVHLEGDRAFDGVLWRTSGPLLVLRHARLLEPGREAAPVDGEVVLDRQRVEFVQVLAGAAS